MKKGQKQDSFPTRQRNPICSELYGRLQNVNNETEETSFPRIYSQMNFVLKGAQCTLGMSDRDSTLRFSIEG